MGLRTLTNLTFLAVLCAATAGAQVFVVGMKTATDDAVTDFTPTHVPLPDAGLTERGRRELLQALVSEQGFAHRQLPLGAGLTLQANGNLTPRDEAYKQMLYKKGVSANPGDRVAITAVEFKGDRIILDFNGGPYAKHRFLSHIELNDNPVAPAGAQASGSRVTLVFEGGIPEITGAEVKALLDPVIDFRAKTSAEAYTDTLPPRVRDAVAAHEVLVGMNKRMVLASIGAPKTKNREHADTADDNSPRFEEWIYGESPQPIRFVRFRGDKVIRVEVAELGKPVQVFDKNQLGSDAPGPDQRVIASGDPQPGDEGQRHAAHPPTLRQPGEADPADATSASAQKPLTATPSSSKAPGDHRLLAAQTVR